MATSLCAVVMIVVAALFFWSPRLPASEWRGNAGWPGWGFTHTQFSADSGETAAVATAETAIGSVPMIQAQAIMGWGVDNPEPSPGQYDFRTLDRRMDFIRRSGGVPVVVLCCAPDWMKGGQAGGTDWDRLEDAPRPEHFADFAILSAEIAKRYPYVRHFLVWNEFKGFFDHEHKTWDARKYVELYNRVYDAVKEVNPGNQVGGPYLDFAQPFDASHSSPYLAGPWGSVDRRVLDAFDYWNHHRRGADFVVVDGHAITGDGVESEFAALKKFAAVNGWLRTQVDLPIWWAEWYVEPSHADWTAERQVALRVAAMIELAGSGADTALYWNPRPDDPGCATCLWTDTRMPDGGRPLPFLTDFLQRFVQSFPPDVDRRMLESADGLLALASDRTYVIVNTTDRNVTAVVDGRQIDFSAYQSRWVSR